MDVTAQEEDSLAADLGLVDLRLVALEALAKCRDERSKAIMTAKGLCSQGRTDVPQAPLALGVIQRNQRLDIEPRAERFVGALHESELLIRGHARSTAQHRGSSRARPKYGCCVILRAGCRRSPGPPTWLSVGNGRLRLR